MVAQSFVGIMCAIDSWDGGVNDALSKLPVFVTDQQLAVAIVGKERADMWVKSTLPLLEAKSGFPRIDVLHGGRPVALIWKWYERYMMLDKSYIPATLEDGKENLEVWTRSSRRYKRHERKPQLSLSSRNQTVLQFMIDNPKLQTAKSMRGIGEKSLESLSNKGAIKRAGKDQDGNEIWTVTDEGRAEMTRIRDWYQGISDA